MHSISSCRFCNMLFLIAKYLCIISYTPNTFAILVCLVSLPLSRMSWPFLHPKGILRSLHLSQRCVEGYGDWWCWILFWLCFWKENFRTTYFVINYIFSYHNIVLTMQWPIGLITIPCFTIGSLYINFTDNITPGGVGTPGLWYSKSLNSPMSSNILSTYGLAVLRFWYVVSSSSAFGLMQSSPSCSTDMSPPNSPGTYTFLTS